MVDAPLSNNMMFFQMYMLDLKRQKKKILGENSDYGAEGYLYAHARLFDWANGKTLGIHTCYSQDDDSVLITHKNHRALNSLHVLRGKTKLLDTLLDFTENMDNFKARTERVNFGLLQLYSDFTWPNLTL